jgi:hypothetical protein
MIRDRTHAGTAAEKGGEALIQEIAAVIQIHKLHPQISVLFCKIVLFHLLPYIKILKDIFVNYRIFSNLIRT